ncbi:uncharacterized protein MICPUCDRAFT_70096, partial [Micromonas pusilla CCMP1545]
MTTEDARAANNVENIISRIRIRRSVGSTLSSCRAASTCSHFLSARADARERRRRRAEETRERTRTTAPRVRTATRARASDRRDARRPRRPRPRADLLARGEAKKKKRSAQLDRDAMSPSALRADCASLAAGIESVASGAALTLVDVDDDGVCVALTMEPRRAVTVIFEDGYPKGSAMATSDEPADETNLGTLNAALQAWRGKTLTVFDVARLLGDAFGVRDAMRELLDACGSVALPTETPDRNRESMPEGRTATAEATTAAAATDARATPAENDDDASASDGEGWPDSDDDDEYGSDAHGNDADDGNDSDGALPEDNELNSDQLTRLYQNKRKCVEREERRVQQKSLASEETRGEMTCDMKQAARAQIFTDKGAFARLSSELFALQERLDPALHVDAVEYDVYEWDVQARFVTTRTGPHTIPLARRAPFLEDGLYDSSLRPGFLAFNHPDTSRRLSTPLLTPFDSAHPAVCRHARTLDPQFKCRGFSPGSGMRQDLELLDAVNGYSHVHLKLHFKADLYPFYPPRVSLVRPKLSGVVPGAVIAHPRLRLRNWQPFRPISSVIEHLRTFLERFARVDLASEMNDDRRFPGGAYDDDQSKLELALARLASCGGGGGGGSEDLL